MRVELPLLLLICGCPTLEGRDRCVTDQDCLDGRVCSAIGVCLPQNTSTPDAGFNDAAPTGFIIETVDDVGDGPIGAAIARAEDGAARLAYGHVTDGLVYAQKEGESWRTDVVDRRGSVDAVSLVLEAGDRPRIAYNDRASGELRFAKDDGAGWELERIDTTLDQALVAVSIGRAPDKIGIVYTAYPTGVDLMTELRYAEKLGDNAWTITTVTSTAERSAEWRGTLAFDGDHQPNILAHPVTSGSALYHYTRSNGRFSARIVDGNGGPGSIKIDLNNTPHVAYAAAIGREVRWARRDANGWQIEKAADAAGFARDTSLALDRNATPHLVFHDDGDNDLIYAVKRETWSVEIIEQAGRVGFSSALILDLNDRPQVVFQDRTLGSLKLAR